VKTRKPISAPARGQKLPVTWGKPAIFASAKKVWNAAGTNRVWLSLTLGDADAELIISGQIGKDWWDNSGISAKEFRDALAQIPKGHRIKLLLNSEGGSVQDGLDMYNAIKARAADVTCHISGYAVSIASVIPLAASRVISPISSIWMIHDPWCLAQGNAEEMRATAEMLDKHGEMLAQIYSDETGKSKKAMRDAMKAETWFTGSQAVEFGLADETEDDTDDTRNSLKAFDVTKYRGLPPAILNVLTPKSAGNASGAGQPKTQTEDSMKKAIVALLKKHSIEASETETDEQLQAKLEKLVADGHGRLILDELKALVKAGGETKAGDSKIVVVDFDAKAEIAALKKSRIQDRVSAYVDSTAITKDELKIFVNAALEDEEGTFKILDEKKSARIGGEAAGAGIEAGREVAEPNGLQGRPTEKLRNLFAKHNGDKAKIFAEFRDNFSYLAADAQRMDRVKNENTFSATITTNFLILGATTKLSPKFASVNLFARDASVDPYKPLASGVMKFNSTVQDGSTTLTNATNFESGDSTIDPVTVTVAQYTEAFHVTNGHFNSGFRMEDLVDAKLASLGSKISQVIGNYLKIANYVTLAPVISVPGAFGFGNMATAWGELKKANRKNIMLDGVYLARIINNPAFLQATPVIPGAGWKNVIGWDNVALHTEFSAAGANVRGFFGDETALGIIAGLPLVDSPAIPGGILAQATGMLPGVNLGIAVYAWFNTATRTYWASFDLMFGANVLDGTAGGLIASGNPG
jgi:ATP-dependent Clp protease, protease subunit